MKTLTTNEVQFVSGAGLGSWIDGVWHDIVQWANSTTNTVNSAIGDLVTQGQPGSNPACNALGNSLSLVGTAGDASDDGGELGAAGTICNNAAKTVQQSSGQNPASGGTSAQ